MTSPKTKKLTPNIPFKAIAKNKNWQKTGLIIGISFVSIGIFIFIFNFSYRDKIFPQTYLGGINLGGQTREEAASEIKNAVSQSGETEVTLEYQDQKWVVKSEDIKLDYQVQETADDAWSVGREGHFTRIFLEQLKSIIGGNKRQLSFNFDDTSLDSKINDISNKVDNPEKDATIIIRNLKPEVQEEKYGQKLNFLLTKKEIMTSFGNLKGKTIISLPVEEIAPYVKAPAAQVAAKEVDKILASDITLKSEKQNYTLKPNDFEKWLIFVGVPQKDILTKIDLKKGSDAKSVNTWDLAVRVNDKSLNDYINKISGDVNQEAKNAKFEVRDGQVAAFQLSQTGYELDKEKSFILISNAVLKDTRNVTLPIKVVQPEITDNSADHLGIKEKIGEGTSSWRGSPKNRIHNLTLGTEKISGSIIKPGEEFSTVKALSPIDAASGYLPELVIKNGNQVIPDIGGGLCQVSTTLFRAALNSGLKITSRSAHSFRVSYYEPPVGMDATIFDPKPDLTFVNNTNASILIWGVASNNSISFQMYGTKDGRNIEISDPVLGSYVSPGAPIYTESASMEPGTIRQVERALSGATASFDYKVTSASGEVLQKETYISKYVPIPNSYLVGPGYTVPPPDEPPAE